MTGRAAFVLGLVAGCDQRRLADHPVRAPIVEVTPAGDVALDALLPSDVALLADGSALVLDGYGGHVLRVDPSAGVTTRFSAVDVGRAARLGLASDGGVWVTRPGSGDEPGSLLHLGPDGAEVGVVYPRGPDGEALHPVDVVERGALLLVADRGGGLVWLDREGAAVRRVTDGPDGEVLRRVVDVEADGEGFATVDTLARRVGRWAASGQPTAAYGRQGLAVGTFARPTAVAPTPSGWLVADSVLGAVQVFGPDGGLVGVLGTGDEHLAFGHPVAVRADAGHIVVLDADPPRLRTFDRAAPFPAPGPAPLLRTTLVEADADPAGTRGSSCLQCHDGLVLDSRQLWDPARTHHPVDVEPEKELPAFFPLEDGRLTCRTCHSPHGVVDEAGDEVDALVRHASVDSPFLRLDRRADALCTACHGEAAHDPSALGGVAAGTGHPAGAELVAALARRPASAAAPATSACLSCHATHGATSAPLLRSADDAPVCAGCHPAQRDRATNHPLGRVPGRDWLAAARSGAHLSTDGGVGCLTCHSFTSAAPRLLRALDTGSPVCLSCHSDRTDLREGPHATLARGGLPACVRCHDVHGGAVAEHFVATGPTSPSDPRGCLECHADDGPGRSGHPVDASLTPAGDPLTCLSCHDPHRADRPDALACRGCHAAQGAAAAAGGHGRATCLDCHPAHADAAVPAGPENPASRRCLACHEPGRVAEGAPAVAAHTHPAPMFLPDGSRWTPLAGLVLYGPDGAPAAPGDNGDLACGSCHLTHGPEGADHLRRASGWKEACAACHGEDGLVLYRTFHDPTRRAALMERTP